MKATMTTKTLAVLGIAFLHASVFAEPRIWTDANGNSIEAEQVKVLNGQVLLRLVDGRQVKVSLDTLSEADRKQAMLDQPPTLELKVSAKTSRSNSSMRTFKHGGRVQLEEETTTVSVAVAKKSSAPYGEPLKAVLYVMGERDGDNNVVLEKVSETFAFTAKEKEFELVSDAFESTKLEGGERRAEYKGWLVAVFDINGEIVAMKGSKREYTENADILMAAEAGAVLSGDYETLKSNGKPELARRRRF